MTFLKHILTGRDNETYSYTKLASLVGVGALTYNFVITQSTDFNGYAFGLASIIAAHALKHHTEKESEND